MGEDRVRYQASMLLSAAGDALGYRNERWEYCKSGVTIHKELAELGGVQAIAVQLPDWRISDDSIMHIATAEGLTCGKVKKEEIFLEIGKKYKECMNDMEGRKPGPTSIKGCDQMDPSKPDGYRIPFNPTGTGCGAAMRSMCIGLRYPGENDEDELIAYSVEAGRMTHHHPTGYLGSLASALFTAYAFRRKPLPSWGRGLMDILPRALAYVESTGISVQENKEAWDYFTDKWNWYLDQRGIKDGQGQPVFPEKYGVEERDVIYETFSIDGWAGRSGHDAPMIAYDALMASGKDWAELCSRSMFHAGDSDSTGVIAAACYGAMNGFEGVPECNHNNLEYRSRIVDLANKLYDASHAK
jgi:ADP-ribosylarginine hydrolase